MALLIRQVFVVLIPYWCNVPDSFTLKIQMSSPVLLTHAATGCVSLVSHVHITCWWHDKGKMGCASQKRAYICSFSYNFSCHVAEDIRDATRGTRCLQLHAQQRTRSYNKKI